VEGKLAVTTSSHFQPAYLSPVCFMCVWLCKRYRAAFQLFHEARSVRDAEKREPGIVRRFASLFF